MMYKTGFNYINVFIGIHSKQNKKLENLPYQMQWTKFTRTTKTGRSPHNQTHARFHVRSNSKRNKA